MLQFFLFSFLRHEILKVRITLRGDPRITGTYFIHFNRIVHLFSNCWCYDFDFILNAFLKLPIGPLIFIQKLVLFHFLKNLKFWILHQISKLAKQFQDLTFKKRKTQKFLKIWISVILTWNLFRCDENYEIGRGSGPLLPMWNDITFGVSDP